MKERFDPELGEMERHCPDCDEWWPATREFFYTTGAKDGGTKLHSYCKACYEERRKRRRSAKRELALQNVI